MTIGGMKVKMPRSRRPKPYERGAEGRFVPSRKVTIITRKDQPAGVMPVRVRRLIRKSYPMKRVSSTNVAMIGYDLPQGIIWVDFISGTTYGYYTPFEIFEDFYYAHSKGTFIHVVLKGGQSKPPYPYDYFKV